jgi:hypothetical protein
MRQSSVAAKEEGLPRWERIGCVLLILALAVYGTILEVRSAYLQRPMTDLQVYLRAAWAVRSGADLYTISDDSHWHYHYPALFAIFMTPLADPPKGVARDWVLPFALSVRCWYLFSVLCTALAVHWLASALEETSADRIVRAQSRGCRRWRYLRGLPVLACLPPIGQTLIRGQVNLLVLALLCGMTAAAIRGRSFRAGLWLAGAICVKVIPAFLLLYPLWRRDRRWLASSAIGLLVGLALIPAAVLGPRKTSHYTMEWTEVLLRPALRQGGSRARDKELIETTATDSQSVERILHNYLYPDPLHRPAIAAPWETRTHWLVGALLTVISLAAAGRRPLSPARTVIFLGSLIIVMNLVSPVCHQHYMALLLPMVMGLIALAWEPEGTTRLRRTLTVLLPVVFIGTLLPFIPGFQVLRDLGVPGGTALLLWATGCIVLWRGERTTAETVVQHARLASAA